jgi:predicted site-specific integrase-resolvase
MTFEETANEEERWVMLGKVPNYLGVSHRVVERLVREGQIKPVKDPLDHRRKLVCRSELDKLKRRSLSPKRGINSDSE